MKKNTKKSLTAIVIVLVACVVLVLLDTLPGVPGMLVTVLQKGAIFSLVAVSMNLMNGFTGLFPLGLVHVGGRVLLRDFDRSHGTADVGMEVL